MHRLLNRPLVTLLVCVLGAASPLAAQFVERAPRRLPPASFREDSTSVAELLQQVAIDYTSTGAKLRLKVVRVWLEVTSRRVIPIVLVANPTILLPEGKDSATFTAKELLSQFGGLLNIAAVRPLKWGDAVTGVNGTQGDLHIGAKMVEFTGTDTSSPSRTGVANAGFTISQFMRAFGEHPTKFASAAATPQAGLVTANLRGNVSYIGGAAYRRTFKDSNGEAPAPWLWTGQADLTVHFFDQFFLSIGWALSNNSRLSKKGFVGVTISRPNDAK